MSPTNNPQPDGATGLDRARLLLALVLRIPLIARVVLLHILHLSENSQYLDLRTEVTIAVIRSFLNSRPRTISSTQKLFCQDPGVKGRIWVGNYTCPAQGETGVQNAVLRAIEGLREDLEDPRVDIRLPEVSAVEAEWTGYRAAATRQSTLPPISERERYDEMMKEVSSPATILYFHGGAYWLMDPATHRPTTKKLAKLTGGRCYSVRYRLAPQHAFPAALIDGLVSYLQLLYPLPGAFHEPVLPEHIVLAGDSAGGNLALALLQTLLELKRQNAPILWNGIERDVPLPAGVAVNSPWMDITHSSPSCTSGARYDYIPAVEIEEYIEGRPACDLWPVDPPRRALNVDNAFLTHPLVTVLLARSWTGSPPVYLCTGWELLGDEDKYAAAKLHADGVVVVYEEYQAMSHCFAMLFVYLAESRRCFKGWSGFIRQVVKDSAAVKPSFTMVKAKTLEEVEVDPEKLSPYTEGEMRAMIGREARGVKKVKGEMSKL
ncbi:alpha/beta hydrolase fold-domain-containing protein [Podospora appendiculata]|uniref:Alpha/beta hydrolase fold-domain-containing protein n=1 Tax=Podospora appendiculata TaxID=314037 RepID=A0AAE0XG55_9PEZI|nr:alpha/beta hydrolase fold-domain-containing protein [Podospora appendiculata]